MTNDRPTFLRFAGAPVWWLGLATLVGAMTLYAPDADGAFAIWDGAWYGHFAEWHPARSILPHHPLFHALVAGLTRALGLLGVAGPGHVAVRVVAGAGGALVLLLVARLSGPGRRGVGAAFALLLFSTRAFVAEAATGENLLPAFAAALWLLECATSASPSLRRMGAAIVLALLFRQDNVLLLPGALIAVAPALPSGRRLRPVAVMLAASGIVVLVLYVLAWAWAQTRTGEGLFEYLTKFGHQARWTGPGSVETNLALHFGSLGAALAGRHWFEPLPHVILGAAWVAAVLLATWLLRGSEPSRRYAVAVVVTIAIRIPLYAWFEPQNFEWQVLPVVLLAALGARTARGAPATAPRARTAGVWVLVALSLAVFAAHAQNTWTLRQRRLASAVDEAIAAGGPHAYYVAVEKNAMLALELRGKAYDRLDTPWGAPVDPIAGIAFKRRAELNLPIVVVADRFIGTGMPYDLVHAAEALASFDAARSTPLFRVLSRDGRNFAAVIP